MITAAKAWLLRQFRFAMIGRWIRPRPGLRILDIGCGRTSTALTLAEFPDALYLGLDMLDPAPFTVRPGVDYRRLDLERDRLDPLAGQAFDLIVISHVIEHLNNGLEVVAAAAALLAAGGVLYVEYPSLGSAMLPSMEGTLNFWDDPTHKRFYALTDVANAMADQGVRLRAGGRRRYKRRMILAPFGIAACLLTHRPLKAGLFWDWLGFADYAVGVRPDAAVD